MSLLASRERWKLALRSDMGFSGHHISNFKVSYSYASILRISLPGNNKYAKPPFGKVAKSTWQTMKLLELELPS